MALSFPLSRAAFMDLLPVQRMTFDIQETLSQTRTRGGEILTADNGARLWQGEITLGQITRGELAAVRPILNLLRGAGASFLAYDISRPRPQLDPDGSGLQGSTPAITALWANGREISLGGLPPGYRISRDDMFAFSYGTNPTRRALHEVVTGGIANAAGNLAGIEVNPPIRPGAAIGAAVSLIKPSCKAVMVPGSYQPGTTRAFLTEGISFKFCQTLR